MLKKMALSDAPHRMKRIRVIDDLELTGASIGRDGRIGIAGIVRNSHEERPAQGLLPSEPVTFEDGEPCPHPGCAVHLSHPCEGCGRIGARGMAIEDVRSVE